MRFITALFAVFLFALSACKEETGKYETIGKFTVEMDGKTVEFLSVLETGGDHNDIRQIAPTGIRTLLLSGAANTGEDGTPARPMISIMLQAGVTSKTLKLVDVNIYDQSYTTPLLAGAGFGAKQITDLVVSDAGEISFSFTADLVRVKMTANGEKLIEGKAGAHIEGSFSGTIPAREMKE